eukprot:353989-Rhodomonas_salina.4
MLPFIPRIAYGREHMRCLTTAHRVSGAQADRLVTSLHDCHHTLSQYRTSRRRCVDRQRHTLSHYDIPLRYPTMLSHYAIPLCYPTTLSHYAIPLPYIA